MPTRWKRALRVMPFCLVASACGSPMPTDASMDDVNRDSVDRDGIVFDTTLDDAVIDAMVSNDAMDDGADDVAFDAMGDAVVDGGTDSGGLHGPFEWIGVIGTGQSLSVGATSTPVTRTQPFHNLRLVDNGPDPKYPLNGRGMLSLVPLIEPIRTPPAGTGPGYSDGQFPGNIRGETPHSAMGNQLTALAMAAGASDYVSIHSAVGWSGHCLRDIDDRGPSTTDGGVGRAFPGALSEARSITQLAHDAGHTFGYGAVILTHGECDASNATYADGLFQMITDYNRELRAITGQSRRIVMLLSQHSASVPNPTGNALNHRSQMAEWEASTAHPAFITLVGPKYQYGYSPDHLHLPAPGYRRLGEKLAEVFDAIVNRGEAWRPLEPLSSTLSGSTITIRFHVPNPPLAWETSLGAPHQSMYTQWSAGRGFEVMDSTGRLTIRSAMIQNDSVVLTLAAAPRGTGLIVRYAMTQDFTPAAGESRNRGGLPDGAHGLLRDSDPLVGWDAETIQCTLTRNSTAITCPATNALRLRALHDIAEAPGLANNTTLVAIASNTAATLSAPYTGATGTVAVRFHYDERNYCVHFEQLVH